MFMPGVQALETWFRPVVLAIVFRECNAALTIFIILTIEVEDLGIVLLPILPRVESSLPRNPFQLQH
jgi:hypothetical protein